MINKIEMYKVGFGDCFICSDGYDRNKMLVDYGSTRAIPQEIINEINNSLFYSQNNYLMITHFHSDHFNGLQHLDKDLNFEEIYLPNFINDDIIKLEFIALASNPKDFTHKSFNIAFNLLTCIPVLARHFIKGTKVFFLNRSSKSHTSNYHENSLDNLRILWPDMDYVEKHAKNLNDIIMRNITDDKIAQLESYSGQFMEIISQSNDNGILYLSRDNVERIQGINNLVEECISELSLELPKKLLRDISSFQNALCLCFDNVNENNDNPVLFLSDISRLCYNWLINVNDIAGFYSTIKVPHHGTSSYFIDNLPDSKNLLIPNDNKRKDWLISSEYFIQYSTRKISPNLPCCILNSVKTKNCTGLPEFFCTHWI